MRILFDHQAFSIQSRGGITRYVLELAARLAAADGVHVHVAAGIHRSEALAERAEPWISGRYLRPVARTGPLRLRLNRYLARRSVNRFRPDVIHETYFQGGRPYASGVPTIVTVYDLIDHLFPDAGRAGAAIRDLQRRTVERADHIICISENTRRDLLRLMPLDPARVSTIPLGVSIPKSPRASADRPAAPAFMLHVGPRHSYKNFDVILRAFAASSELRSRLDVIAFGERPFSTEELARMRSLGLDPAKFIHRTGDDDALSMHYRSAAVYVCPSLYEGFGLPSLEAMAHGCPVVCSNRGSLPDVTGNAAILFDPESPAELARSLLSVINIPSLAEDLRARGRRQAGVFGWERCARETLGVYRQVISGRGHPRVN